MYIQHPHRDGEVLGAELAHNENLCSSKVKH
uniref:Uncharacterized protein n=1 Tax=Anguilla anguilla TaxID=7936 RepID=A0A0E9U5Z3_ANGAN